MTHASSEENPRPFSLVEVRDAQRILSPYLKPTPLIFSAEMAEKTGQAVWLKLETQQPTGSFKVRPAFYSILRELESARARGIITSSSGNFAQAVGYAAQRLDCTARVVMMPRTSPYKMARTRAWGAEVILCEDSFRSRWDTTREWVEKTGGVFLHPYDSAATILGDATLAAELLDDLPARDFTVYVPASGGGLLAGVASLLKQARPGCRIVGVQPQANSSLAKSLAAGTRVEVPPFTTLADALIATMPGEKTFTLIQRFVDDFVTVTEDEIREATCSIFADQKLVVEPGGAVSVAGFLQRSLAMGGSREPAEVNVCVLTGGNIPIDALSRLF